MIEYHFAFEGGGEETFQVELDRSPADADRQPSPWTLLGVHQCSNCPLSADEHPRCPAAVDTAHVLERFASVVSFDRARVTVRMAGREHVKDCDMQSALQSLLGLIMATSGCPILAELRALAEHHLPFATRDETLQRAVANHLLKQFFAARRGETPDWALDDLRRLYDDLETVNRCFLERIRVATQRDAALNAIIGLFAVSLDVKRSLEASLERLADRYSR